MGSIAKISVLMFPWLAHGHLSPFLELGTKLSNRNFTVYLCSTPANLVSIRKKIGQNCKIQLVELNLPTLPNLPPERHTTNGLSPTLMASLKEAYDLGKPNFSDVLKSIKPDLVIYDFLRAWPAEAAAEQNIPAVQFIATSATMTSYMLHASMNPGDNYPFSWIYYHDYEHSHVDYLIECGEFHAVMQSLERSNKIILVKGFKEMEGRYSRYLSDLAEKKVVHVGPLVQEPLVEEDECDTIKWLNKKEKGSTVFVSFGSEYFLSKKDFEEIAHGLLLSNVNFIWVVRFPTGNRRTNLKKELPRGFYKRAGDRGRVLEGWAPQAQILGHSSIGGFVSHCGFNSVLESMKFGVPIIAMPMHLDQPINARLLQEVGAGIEVARNRRGRLEREKIGDVIRRVVVDDMGRNVRARANEFADVIRRKGEEEIDEVVEELTQLYLESKAQR